DGGLAADAALLGGDHRQVPEAQLAAEVAGQQPLAAGEGEAPHLLGGAAEEAELRPGGHVPEADRLVVAGAGEPRAVGAPAHPSDVVGVAGEGALESEVGEAPDLDQTIDPP